MKDWEHQILTLLLDGNEHEGRALRLEAGMPVSSFYMRMASLEGRRWVHGFQVSPSPGNTWPLRKYRITIAGKRAVAGRRPLSFQKSGYRRETE